jgi:hypothetical protein
MGNLFLKSNSIWRDAAAAGQNQDTFTVTFYGRAVLRKSKNAVRCTNDGLGEAGLQRLEGLAMSRWRLS